MNISGFRFRNEGSLLVLQVHCFIEDTSPPRYDYSTTVSGSYKWRDAKTEDLMDVAELLQNRYAPAGQVPGDA